MKKIEQIKESLLKANQHTAKAAEHLAKAKGYQNKLKVLGLIVSIFITITLSAQSFEKINGLGRTESSIIRSVTQFSFHKDEGIFQGQRVDYWHSNDYGLVGYIYDKNYVCIKMIIPTVSKLSYDLKDFKITKLQNCNITIIEKF